MKILVTGATGFLGHNFLDQLMTVSPEPEIWILARDPQKAQSLKISLPKPVTIVQGDLCQPETLQNWPQDFDLVFHLAALVGLKDGDVFYEVNTQGTAHLLAALQEQVHLKRLVYISSIAAIDRPLDAKPPYHPLDEASPAAPRTDYGRSKYQAEQLIKNSSFPYTILRPAYIFGPYPRKGSSMDKVIYDAVDANPYTRFPYTGRASEIYAPDLAEIIWLVANTQACENEDYFVGNMQPVAVRDFFSLLYGLLNRQERPYPIPGLLLPLLKRLMIQEGLQPILGEILFEDYFVCNVTKLYRHIQYRPYYGFAAGLTKTLQWYRQNQLVQ